MSQRGKKIKWRDIKPGDRLYSLTTEIATVGGIEVLCVVARDVDVLERTRGCRNARALVRFNGRAEPEWWSQKSMHNLKRKAPKGAVMRWGDQ